MPSQPAFLESPVDAMGSRRLSSTAFPLDKAIVPTITSIADTHWVRTLDQAWVCEAGYYSRRQAHWEPVSELSRNQGEKLVFQVSSLEI